jgi:hypothetical protein
MFAADAHWLTTSVAKTRLAFRLNPPVFMFECSREKSIITGQTLAICWWQAMLASISALIESSLKR